MDTQQLGTDIAADVSFDFGGPVGAFRPTYQFKGRVTNPGVGDYRVFVNPGEGIDFTHAEVDVHYTPLVSIPSSACLSWIVGRLANTAADEAVFFVHFYKPTTAGPSITFTLTDVAHGSITIRRKVPAVV